MFSLANGKLIRINSDGSEAEPIQTKNSSLSIGTSVLSDCCISNSTLDPTTTLAYEISTDNFGRVSTVYSSTDKQFAEKHFQKDCSINGEKKNAMKA